MRATKVVVKECAPAEMAAQLYERELRHIKEFKTLGLEGQGVIDKVFYYADNCHCKLCMSAAELIKQGILVLGRDF